MGTARPDVALADYARLGYPLLVAVRFGVARHYMIMADADWPCEM